MNNKGYLLVEIIVASVIAMSMMYFLLEMTIKLKNINEDYYVETKLETDQILMIKDVMEDILNNELNEVVKDNDNVIFSFNQNDETLKFRTKISITKEENNYVYQYGKIEDDSYEYRGNVYKKTLDSKLNVGDFNISCTKDGTPKECSEVDKGILKIDMVANTAYNDNNYGINIIIPYSKSISIADDPCSVVVKYKCTNNNNCTLLEDNKILQISASETLTIEKVGKCPIEYALVGGGSGGNSGLSGSSSTGNSGGKGGAGGKVLNGSIDAFVSGQYSINIGQGGSEGTAGTASTIKYSDTSIINLTSNTGEQAPGGNAGISDYRGYDGGVGSAGIMVQFASEDYKRFGSSGGGGGGGSNNNYSAYGKGALGGSTNAGTGGNGASATSQVNATSGTNATGNTGSGGGGGGGGGGSLTTTSRRYPGSGGKGGNGVILLYYESGWELLS